MKGDTKNETHSRENKSYSKVAFQTLVLGKRICVDSLQSTQPGIHYIDKIFMGKSLNFWWPSFVLLCPFVCRTFSSQKSNPYWYWCQFKFYLALFFLNLNKLLAFMLWGCFQLKTVTSLTHILFCYFLRENNITKQKGASLSACFHRSTDNIICMQEFWI